MNAKRYDVVVVGARCAGASTAMLLARAGLRVLAIDRSRYGSDTLSTHALMRAGVLQLHRWGVLDAVRTAGTPPVRSTTFHYGSEELRIVIKPSDGLDALYAPRRTVLDRALVDAARMAGAEVRHGVRVEGLMRSSRGSVRGVAVCDGRGDRSEIEAELVVGADGADSLVARLAEAERVAEARHRTALVYGYWEGLPADGYHWFYRKSSSAGVIPTSGGLTCIFVSVPPERLLASHRRPDGYRRLLLEAAPELREALASARQVGACRGFPGRRGFFRRAYGPGWALVGDAGYFKDPITAHGISDALRDAELLARAIVAGSEGAMARYASERDRLSRALFEVTDSIASFDWDVDSVRGRHRELSEAMAPEIEMLRQLDVSHHDGERQAATAA